MRYWLAVIALGLIALFVLIGCGEGQSSLLLPPDPWDSGDFDYAVCLYHHHDVLDDRDMYSVSLRLSDYTDSLTSASLRINGDPIALTMYSSFAYTFDASLPEEGTILRLEGEINGRWFDSQLPLAFSPNFELENNWWFYQNDDFHWSMGGDNMSQNIYGELAWLHHNGHTGSAGSDSNSLRLAPNMRQVYLSADWVDPHAPEDLEYYYTMILGVHEANWCTRNRILFISEAVCEYSVLLD